MKTLAHYRKAQFSAAAILLIAAAGLILASPAFSQGSAPPATPANSINIVSEKSSDSDAPAPPVSSTIYRQVRPDGGTVYSDQPLKGVRVQRALTVPPLIKGNGWTTDNSMTSTTPDSEPTVIRRRSDNAESGAKRTRDDAQADVTRAEMLLEDAKRRLADGAVPLPGERTGTVSGKSRLNQRYETRQDELERDVTRAENNLQRAITERNNMR